MIQKAGLSDLVISLIVILIIISIAIGYQAYQIGISIPVEVYALFAGLLYQSFRITGEWRHVLYKFIGAFFFSLYAFVPGENEAVYHLAEHLTRWSYYFIGLYAFITAIVYKEKLKDKLTEGITLILSLSAIYWVLDYGFAGFDTWPRITLLILVLTFSLFSMVHALTHIRISRRNRLILSIWTTIITFAFALDHIISVFFLADYNSTYFPQVLFKSIQYFLLGISAVYIMRDYILLSGLIPSRNGGVEILKETIQDHILGYSDQQVSRKHALFCIAYTASAYGLNFYFNFLPVHTMIWLVIFSFPLLLELLELYGMKRRVESCDDPIPDGS